MLRDRNLGRTLRCSTFGMDIDAAILHADACDNIFAVSPMLIEGVKQGDDACRWPENGIAGFALIANPYQRNADSGTSILHLQFRLKAK